MKTLYTSPHRPDGRSALDVLAFLLVKPETLVDMGDDLIGAEVTLRTAQRQALLDWYAFHTGGRL